MLSEDFLASTVASHHTFVLFLNPQETLSLSSTKEI